MPTLRFNDGSIQTDEDGFLLNGNQWTPAIAEAIASSSGIDRLTDKHWKVIAQCREEAARGGQTLGAGRISTMSGLDGTELMRLFPGDPEKLIARIAGLPRPQGAEEAGGEVEEAES